MRTTLTLDADVARLVADAVHRERRPMKQVVNEALRRALAPAASADQPPYRLGPHNSAVRPGLDSSGFNRLADDFEDEVRTAAWGTPT
ncbi:MAG: type II toxin-antitoxin system antitoxin VapB33 [Mycobacteriales bacterium]